MVDNGTEAPGERRARDFQSVLAVHADWIEALHEVFVWFSVSRILPPLPLHGNRHFPFPLFMAKKLLYRFYSPWIVSYSLNEPRSSCIMSPTMYRNTHCIIVKMYHYTPNTHQSNTAISVIYSSGPNGDILKCIFFSLQLTVKTQRYSIYRHRNKKVATLHF